MPSREGGRERKPISKSVRFDVFHRDGFTCQYCGQRPPAVVLELDHIHPHSQGGDDTAENLVTSCSECNQGKAAKILTNPPLRPDADLQYLRTQQEIAESVRFLEAQERLKSLMPRMVAVFQDAWDDHFPFSRCPREENIRGFLRHDDLPELLEAMRIASKRHHARSLGTTMDIENYIRGILRNWKGDRS